MGSLESEGETKRIKLKKGITKEEDSKDNQEIRFEELLPIKKIEGKKINIEYTYETGIEKNLNLILPMYIQDIIYGIILDSKTAEHSARMNSMKNATDNADEVIEKLQLLYKI